MSLINFFQSSSGESSSKRLAFLASQPIVFTGFLYLIYSLSNGPKPELAITAWNSFLVYCGFLGGMVTAEIALAFVKILKGRDKHD